MNNYVDISNEQKSIINKIKEKELYQGVKTVLMVIMSTNDYSRNIKDIAGILCEYSGMPKSDELESCIKECIREGLLKEKESLGQIICYQDEECLSKFLSSLPKEISDDIVSYRKKYRNSKSVQILGHLSGDSNNYGYIYSSFLQLLKEARYEILLPMLNRKYNDEEAKILIDKAKSGVKVKILLPDYDKVVKKIRMTKEDNTKDWINRLKNIDNIEIRIYKKLIFANIYSSVIIDKKILRMSVFDYKTQKSSNGIMLHAEDGEKDLNLIHIMNERFNEIWISSKPYGKIWISGILSSKICICLFLFVAFFVGYYYTSDIVQNFFANLCVVPITLVVEEIIKFLFNQYIIWNKRRLK